MSAGLAIRASVAVGRFHARYELEVRPGAPFSEAVEVSVRGAGASLPLGRAATGSVWVSTLSGGQPRDASG